jgi:hypothetical protein
MNIRGPCDLYRRLPVYAKKENLEHETETLELEKEYWYVLPGALRNLDPHDIVASEATTFGNERA